MSRPDGARAKRAMKKAGANLPPRSQDAITCPWHAEGIEHPEDAPRCFTHPQIAQGNVHVVPLGHLIQWLCVRVGTTKRQRRKIQRRLKLERAKAQAALQQQIEAAKAGEPVPGLNPQPSPLPTPKAGEQARVAIEERLGQVEERKRAEAGDDGEG